jgi:hypothetical protein
VAGGTHSCPNGSRASTAFDKDRIAGVSTNFVGWTKRNQMAGRRRMSAAVKRADADALVVGDRLRR